MALFKQRLKIWKNSGRLSLGGVRPNVAKPLSGRLASLVSELNSVSPATPRT